jgi:hypothetical protein
MHRPQFAPVGSCGAAMVFQYNRIFEHSCCSSLLLLAVSTATAMTQRRRCQGAMSIPVPPSDRAGCVEADGLTS